MIENNTNRFVPVLILMVASVLLIIVFLGVGGGSSISMSPSNQSVGVGDTFLLTIEANNVDGVFAYQFDVQFDQNILEFVAATKGTLLSSGGSQETFYLSPSTSTPGLINDFVETALGANVVVDSSGVMGQLEFRVISKGITNLTFIDVKISDANEQPIEVSISGTSVEGI